MEESAARASDIEVAGIMQEYLRAMTDLGKFSGAVLVARRGTVIHCAGYGFANREHSVANTARMKFRIGSITKQFTAMAILQLHEAGKLRLYDPIRRYLPYGPDSWQEITVHHLLNHTSGLRRTNDTPSSEILPLTLQERVETIARGTLQFRPGTRHEYSNDGYILLGDIVERVSGMRYEDVLREGIFSPLEMADSGFDQARRILADRASGYRKAGGEWVNADYMDMGCPFSAGGLYSTVEDLYRWDQAMQARWLVSTESHEIMRTVAPLLANYGYGLAMGQQYRRRTIGHAGGINGFRANYVQFPDEPACVIVLSNLEESDFFGVSATLGAILFGEDYAIPVVKTPAPIAKARLTVCAGVYEILPDVTLTVQEQGTHLLVTSSEASSGVGRRFLPETDALFFAPEDDQSLTFHASDDGAVSHLTLKQGPVETTARKLPERRDTRLIIVEGIVGSGKSTTGAFLENHLASQDVSARFLPEWIMPHPIRLDDTLPHPYEPWRDVTVDEYLERSRAKWAAFVQKRRFQDTVTILDGQLFHGDLTNLLMMGANRPQLDRHIAEIAEIAAPLRPAVIYLAPGDIRRRVEAMCQERGDDWKRRQVAWKTNSPYCRERDLSRVDGLIRMVEDYALLTDRLFAELTMDKLQIDVQAGEWARYRERMSSFLPVAAVPGRKRATGERRVIAIGSPAPS